MLKNLLIKTGEKYGFRKDAFNQFYIFIARNFQPVDISNFNTIRNLFLNDMITETGDMTIVMSIVKAGKENRPEVYSAFAHAKNSVVIDFQEITSRFVSGTKTDFDLLVNLCLIFVTIALILAFGRIETGIITSIPMFVSWLWTLGFMGVSGIKFNIFNIVVSTFVFGLGVDYAILMMRGLLLEYKYGQKEISYYKTSIFLSAFTTVVGVGVLLLARHPSLNSIALISVVGLFSVVLISYTVEPVLFNWLVSKKGKKRAVPLTFADILFTVVYLSIGLIFCILLNILLFLVLPLPVSSKEKKRILHYGLLWSLKISSLGLISIKRKTINESGEDFIKPSVIIANHQSHIDLPLVLMLSPKIIILTNKWVWNNPLYALVIRYLGFYSVTKGFEPLIDKLRKHVEDGYSILVFPEGTRSPDSSVKRFHKGAFLLAEKLNLDITPLIIHGAGDCMNKGENHLLL
jgi:1-acyl-sn-glycerol-3-phosphate acyltransferase